MATIIKIKRDAASGDVPFPSYATPGSAGLDLRSSERALVEPGEYAVIRTGIRLEIPSGYEGQVRPRSGLAAKHGVTLLNSPGTIDSDYRGEVNVILINHGKESFGIEIGDRIAQIVFAPCVQAELTESCDLSDSSRASGGFGSTGIK
jgi:dUTP pyrophosphatase